MGRWEGVGGGALRGWRGHWGIGGEHWGIGGGALGDWRRGRFGRVVFHRHRALAPQKNAVDAKLEKTSLSASVF